MSSTFDKSLRSAIEVADNERIVDLLEPQVQSGDATESEKLLYGVLLLLPPLVDYDESANVFIKLLGWQRRIEPAVWAAYRFAVMQPDGDRSFEAVLKSESHSAVAAHMLSMIASAENNLPLALLENQRSRSLGFSPFSIVEAIKLDSSIHGPAKNELWRTACDLIVSRSAESDPAVYTVEGALQRHWDNLILGTRLTSHLWNHYKLAYGAGGE